jgi:ribosome biogenesis GTPase A
LGEFLLDHYGQRLQQRYGLDSAANSAIELLDMVGKRRGCLRRGGHVDLEKVSSLLVNEFRDGLLGRITLETPSMIATEEQQVALKKAEKAAREAARKKKKRNGEGHSKQWVR